LINEQKEVKHCLNDPSRSVRRHDSWITVIDKTHSVEDSKAKLHFNCPACGHTIVRILKTHGWNTIKCPGCGEEFKGKADSL
jgi:transcription elongation factor Elf1